MYLRAKSEDLTAAAAHANIQDAAKAVAVARFLIKGYVILRCETKNEARQGESRIRQVQAHVLLCIEHERARA